MSGPTLLAPEHVAGQRARAAVAEAGPAFLGGAGRIGVEHEGACPGTVDRDAVVRLLMGGGT